MSVLNMKGNIIKASIACSLLLFCSAVGNAAETAAPSLLRTGHVLSDSTVGEAWTQVDVFDKSLDIINYASKLGNRAKPTNLMMGKIGGNLHLSRGWILRTELMYGSQTIERTLEPKITNSKMHSETALLQWYSPKLPLVIEAGYERHTFPPIGFSVYQSGTTTVTAAPGQDLLVASSKDSAWVLAVTYPMNISDKLSVKLGVESKLGKVEAHYTSYDATVLSFIGASAPQSTPWDELQYNASLSLNYKASKNVKLALDFKQVNINRRGYIPRAGFKDYTSTQILDVWGFYDVSKNVTFMMRGHINTHYLLGEIPSAYNRRVNDKFKHPFGYLSVGLAYK